MGSAPDFGLAGLLDFAGDRVGADVVLRQVVKSKSLKGGRRLVAEARKLLTARSHDDEHTHHLLWPGDPIVEVSGERIELAHFLAVVDEQEAIDSCYLALVPRGAALATTVVVEFSHEPVTIGEISINSTSTSPRAQLPPKAVLVPRLRACLSGVVAKIKGAPVGRLEATMSISNTLPTVTDQPLHETF